MLDNVVSPTDTLRSGDRVRNGMVIGGLSFTGLAIVLEPYISFWMNEQTRRGIEFRNPEAWQDAVTQIAVIALTGLWGTVHMLLIRLADRLRQSNETGA